MYFSAQEMLAQLEGTDERICDLVIKNEIELFQTSYDEIMKNLEERYQIMYNCAHDALEKEIRSLSGLTGGSALKMWNYYKKGNSICDNTVIRGAAYALSCLEVNASMGLIVAAPTAGACGILPGALLTVAENMMWITRECSMLLPLPPASVSSSSKKPPYPAQRAVVRQSAEVRLPWLLLLSQRCLVVPQVRHLMQLLSLSRTSWDLSATQLLVWLKCPVPNEMLPA